MSAGRWFADQSISRKVYGGFSLMVILAAAALGFGLFAMNTTKQSFHRYRAGASENAAIAAVTQTVAELRLEVRRYVHQPSEQIAADALKKIDQLDRIVEQMLRDLSVFHQDDREHIEKILVASRNYRAGFEKTIAAQKRFDDVVASTYSLAANIDAALSAAAVAAVKAGDAATTGEIAAMSRAFLQARIAALQFRLTFDPALSKKSLGQLEELAAILQGLTARAEAAPWAPALQELTAALPRYRANIEAGGRAQSERNDIVAQELQRHGQVISDISAELSADVIKEQEELGAAVEHRSRDMISSAVIALVALLAVGLALAAAIGRSVARPAVQMTRAMTDLADGRLDTEIPAADRRDEIGGMAAALAVFRDALRRNRHVEAEQRRAAEQRAERAERIARLTGDFDAAVSGVLAAVSSAAEQMRGSAASMADASRRVGDQAAAVASAADDASANVQTVAASAEELTASINEIGRQVETAARAASEAAEAAAHTSGVVSALADSARKIGQVVGVISDIAGQTNLLALNATIEAARAGEAGRGFAVVASEVKTLASQTARATEDVTRQVQEIQTATDQAVLAIDGIVAKVERINGVQHSIAAAVEEQTAVTRDIARNTQAAASGAEHVSEAIDSVDAAARGAGSAAEQMLGASQGLADQSAILKRSVDGFLTAVRNA